MRTDAPSEPCDAFYRDFYGLDMLGPYDPDRATFMTKLMVTPAYARTRLGTQLAMTIYRAGCMEGDCFNLIDCNPPLKRYFKRLGYRDFLPDAAHSDDGLVHRMILVNHDKEHLKTVRSPFTPLLPELPQDPDAVKYYYEHVANRSETGSISA